MVILFINSKDLLESRLILEINSQITKRYKQDGHLATVCTSGVHVSPITVYSYDHGFLFNCTTVSQASDSMKARCKTFIRVLVPDACL